MRLRNFAFLAGVTRPPAAPSEDPVVTDWAARVVTNGGAAPSAGTRTALDTFYKGLVADGLSSVFHTLNCMVPDSLAACLTPLIKTQGIDPWGNTPNAAVPFSAASLSVNGLIGNGTSYLSTNVSAAVFNKSSYGITVYIYDGTNDNTSRDMGTMGDNSYNYPILLYPSFASTCYWDFVTNAGFTRIFTAQTPSYQGYLHACYHANNAYVYKANSGTAHTQLMTGGPYTDAASLPDSWMYFFSVSTGPNNYSASYPTAKRFSFCALSAGLTAVQSAALYARVQQMRTDLGGGYR